MQFLIKTRFKKEMLKPCVDTGADGRRKDGEEEEDGISWHTFFPGSNMQCQDARARAGRGGRSFSIFVLPWKT